jgi:hypothetical protein
MLVFLLCAILLIGCDAWKITNWKKGLGQAVTAVGVSVGLLTSSPVPSLAAPLRFMASQEQSVVDELSDLQKNVAELADQLKPTLQPNAVGVYIEQQILKDGKDDSDVVLLYSEQYLKPIQSKMALIAPKIVALAKDSADKERIALLPNLMKGHLLELSEAIKHLKASEELKEVEEVQETLAEFLLQASRAGLEVQPFIPTRPLSDKDLFGPLSCEWWGRTRVEGSNACTTVEAQAAAAASQ